MKFGIVDNTGALGVDPAHLTTIAHLADDLGFESFYLTEHITLSAGARVGEVEFSPDLPPTDLDEQRRRLADFAERHRLRG